VVTTRPFGARRRHRRGAALEYSAVLFVVLVCFLLVLQSFRAASEQRARELDHARQVSANLAQSLSQHASDIFRTTDASIIGIARRIESDGFNSANLDQAARGMSARMTVFPVMAGWAVSDENGNCLTGSLVRSLRQCAINYKDNLEYHRSHQDDVSYIGEPFQTTAAEPWLLPVSHRLNRPDGSFAGIITGDLSLDYFQHFYDTFDIGQLGSILLAKRDGMLLVRRPFAARNIGRDLHSSHFFQNYVTHNLNGDVEVASATDGITRLNSYRAVSGYPLFVSVALATNEVLAPWSAERRARLVRVGIMVGVIGGLGFWLAAYIRRGRRLENAYYEAADAFRLLAEHSSDLIVKIGRDMRRHYVSPASRSLLGYEPEDLLGHPTDDILYPPDRAIWEHAFNSQIDDTGEDVQATYRVRRKNGDLIWVEVNRRTLPENEGFVVVSRDVTARKTAEDQLTQANLQLENLAHRDGLTGLANRRYFDDALQTEFARARREGKVLSLIMIDVDCFKLFNDRYGHPAGDKCLHAIANVLAKLPARAGDLVARYGGEEMAIILPNTPIVGALQIAERARLAVRQLALSHEGNGPKIVTISLGVAAAAPDSGATAPVDLIKAADGALYEAKRGGRDQSRVAQATSAAEIVHPSAAE